MPFQSALGTGAMIHANLGKTGIQLRSHYTGGNCNDSISDQDNNRCEKLPHYRRRSHVPVANRRNRDNRPIDGLGHIRKSIILGDQPLDHEHHGPQDHRNRDYAENEDRDLGPTRSEGVHEMIGLPHVTPHLQHTEDSKETQDPHDHEIVGSGEENRQVGRKNRNEVNDSVEAENVAFLVPDDPDPGSVFDGEENGENPFHDEEELAMLGVNGIDAFQHHDDDADPDRNHKDHVECLGSRSVREKDHPPDTILQIVALVFLSTLFILFFNTHGRRFLAKSPGKSNEDLKESAIFIFPPGHGVSIVSRN